MLRASRAQAPARVAKLALLDTSARPDTPEQTPRRHAQIAHAQGGRFAEVGLRVRMERGLRWGPRWPSTALACVQSVAIAGMTSRPMISKGVICSTFASRP
jgi:hypothetical protein